MGPQTLPSAHVPVGYAALARQPLSLFTLTCEHTTASRNGYHHAHRKAYMPLPSAQGSFCFFSRSIIMGLQTQRHIWHGSSPRYMGNRGCDMGGVTPTGQLEQAIFRAMCGAAGSYCHQKKAPIMVFKSDSARKIQKKCAYAKI